LEKKKVRIIMLLIVIVVAILYALIAYFGGLRVINNIVDRGEEGVPQFYGTIIGLGEYALQKPMDVTLDKDGNVLVTDTNHRRVVVFDSNGEGKLIFGSKDEEEGGLSFPYGIAVDSKGNIYVADMYENRIAIFDQAGKFTKYFEPEDDYQFDGPGQIRIYDDKLYVPEVQSGNVSVFDLKGKQLVFMENKQDEDSTLNLPNAVTIDDAGQIYISDTGRGRIAIFSDKGKYIKAVTGSEQEDTPTLTSPRGIIVEKSRRILVTDMLAHEVIGYNSEENKKVVEFGAMGINAGEFQYPSGMYQTSDGMIYIVDSINHRIQKFK